MKYPIYRPSLAGRERDYVLDCVDSTWISSKGKYVDRFENAFADYVGARHAASVCNGTVALHLALLSLDIGEGDEVIVPTFTYVASVNAITYTGAVPVFAESRRDTWQLDASDVETRITPRTKAILLVHLYGHPCDIAEFRKIADRHGLHLIEDCAEAIGTRYHGQHVGTFGDVACFSFFGNKTITTGEGGMVVTSRAEVDAKVRHLKGQGLASGREYWHDVIGYNYRMTNICAALGCAQLERIETIIENKQRVALAYQDALKDTPAVFQHQAEGVVHSHWMCSILTRRPEQRDPLRKRLSLAGIETRPLFPPIHLMPMYAGAQGDFPVAEDLAARGMNLPSYPELSPADIHYITDVMTEEFNEWVV
ncbi:MAG: DegT/DnrJ/EryC1/StrS family aminotransferase [Rhodocyclaceae bacterium]|nr:DegT/DnrJ/EryC1/StrS family aminotransferase [Rhodocyclaceae bacterium]